MGQLQLLPRVEDRLTFLYVEHAKIDGDKNAVVLHDQHGRVRVPIAALSVLLLGPGTSITHAALERIAKSEATAVLCGEDGVRFYASGGGADRSARNLMAQATAWADKQEHLEVVKRMYRARFRESLPDDWDLNQIRGREGVRVRETYAQLSRETGVQWNGRAYKPGEWSQADPVNRALSAANACLYGVCQAAIVGTGFSAGLGFVHTGKSLAFVYDIADLYKCETTVPAAFRVARDNPLGKGIESAVRREVRELFRTTKLLQRIVPDIQYCLGLREGVAKALRHPEDDEQIIALWGPSGDDAGGRNYAEDA